MPHLPKTNGMPKLVLYLAFANDAQAHLPLLKAESRQLLHLLSGLHDKNAIELHRDESTTVDDLIQQFRRFDQRLAIFHFGGHAESRGLVLDEGDAKAEGLAQLFSQQGQLQLVFLNGCSTKGQVERLMALGVKAVMATSVPVADSMAKDFATYFYEALTVKRTLEKAFEFAVAALMTKYRMDQKPAIVEYRDIMGFQPKANENTLPWGLYINQHHPEVRHWRLPDSPIQHFPNRAASQYKPNDYLPKILGAMARYDDGLKQVIEEVKNGRKDKREVLPLIIQHLPWTIGAQLQKLISRSDSMLTPGPDRLQQTIQTYLVAAKTLLYIQASQLWDVCREATQNLDSNPLGNLLTLDAQAAQYYDYVAAFRRLGTMFQARGWPPFVKEFTQLWQALAEAEGMAKKSPFHKAYLLLESIREQLASQTLDANLIPQLCEEAENSLTIFIGAMSFLINYKMIAIRHISVTSKRNEAVAFYHKLGSLNAADSTYLTLDSNPRPFQNHVESDAILLVDDLETEKIDRFLSLSPFIFDNNAYLDAGQESLDIYLYDYAEGAHYLYRNVNSQYQKMAEHQTYTLSTAYEERVEEKNEMELGWELNESSVKMVQPYAVLKAQFDHFKKDIDHAN